METGAYRGGLLLGKTIRGLFGSPSSIALLIAASCVTVGLFKLAEVSRYEIAGAGPAAMVFRLDRLTGEVVPCVPRQEGWGQGVRVVECGSVGMER